MKNRPTNSSVDCRQIVRHKTRSSALTTVEENETTNPLVTLPIDLIIEILSRLPAKSIAICRCVSKQWSSLLRCSDFTESFLKISSARPRLLFTIEYNGKWHFFSSHRPRNLDEHVSVLATEYHMSVSGDWCNNICLYANGFIYLNDKQMLKGKIERVPVIFNPSTGQKLSLPKIRAKNVDLRSFLGYDPIDKELKVLCMTVTYYKRQTNSREHQVLTLGKGKLSWRNIECSCPHYPDKHINGICINGVLYYKASSDRHSPMIILIASFNVRSEKFSLVELNKSSSHTTSIMALMNYNGKLGILEFHYDGSRGYKLWVLDDMEKGWKNIFFWPTTYLATIESISATDTGEIVWVFSSRWISSLYVFYYNVERKSFRRFEIKGIEEKLLISSIKNLPKAPFTFIDHVENVMFL